MPPFLQRNDKYALVTFEDVPLPEGIPLPFNLADDVRVLGELPPVRVDDWKTWLGSLAWEGIEARPGLFIIVRAPNEQPGVLNHRDLRNRLMAFLHALALTGWPYTGRVHMLCGNVDERGPDIRQHSEPMDFKIDPDIPRPDLNEATLREVYDLSQRVLAFNAGGWHRIKRGYRAFLNAMRMTFAEDRLHLFVRALDGILKTPFSQGRTIFARRGATFLPPDPANDQVLQDMYFIRGAIEHVRDPEEEPSRIPNPVERKRIRERRLRQLEVLTRHVYRRIIRDSELRDAFATDAGIDLFWALPEQEQRQRWDDQVNLNAIE